MAVNKFLINYKPVIAKENIYHRAGWKDCIDHLTSLSSPSAVVKLIDLVEDYYHQRPPNPSLRSSWIGIMHHVPGVPKSEGPYLPEILEDERFKGDLRRCLGLITLSKYLQGILSARIPNIPIYQLYHPIKMDVAKFSWDKYLKNPHRKLLFIGNQDRRLDRFLTLDCQNKLSKVWLSGQDAISAGKKLQETGLKITDVTLLRVNNEEYDRLLTENLVMVDLYNSSANNTIIECMARNTPLFVNPVGGVKEYLGPSYPLYFSDLDELTKLINDEPRIASAHRYLTTLDKTPFTFERFNADLLRLELATKVIKINRLRALNYHRLGPKINVDCLLRQINFSTLGTGIVVKSPNERRKGRPHPQPRS